MKKETSWQLTLALIILLGGGALLGGEYFLIKWLPRHRERVLEQTLKLLPYRNATLGIQMQVAAGIYGKVEDFPNGAKIRRPKFWSVGPSLTITSQPNPDRATEFSPEVLAKWQTQGTIEEIPRYDFERISLDGRDAVLISQFKGRSMLYTLRAISPERVIEANCTPGAADEMVFERACKDSLRSLRFLSTDRTGLMEVVP